MPYSVKGFFEINEDMVQILLMLEVLFTQDSKVEDLFCGASSGSEPSLFFSNYFFSLGFQPIQDDFQHDFARMTDEADSSVVLAELQVALFRECNNQRLFYIAKKKIAYHLSEHATSVQHLLNVVQTSWMFLQRYVDVVQTSCDHWDIGYNESCMCPSIYHYLCSCAIANSRSLTSVIPYIQNR